MNFQPRELRRFKSRRDAERVLAEILEDGGREDDFRIDQDRDGSCVIVILEHGSGVVGRLGA